MSVYLRKLLRFLPIYILLMIISTACVSFRESDQKVFRKFKKTTVTPKIHRTRFENKELRYISDKEIDARLPTILFIHGAPGSAGNYFSYLKDPVLGEKANLITVDRLGYGYSDHGNAETSIDTQAESIFAIAEKHKLEKIILVGWSYGVPIAAKMAYKFNEIKHSVLVAGAVSPKDEKLSHIEELTKMLDDWGQIQSPITYYHGTKDNVVPFENMNFIKSNVSDAILKAVVLKDMNHFILSKKYEVIQKELLEILETLK